MGIERVFVYLPVSSNIVLTPETTDYREKNLPINPNELFLPFTREPLQSLCPRLQSCKNYPRLYFRPSFIIFFINKEIKPGGNASNSPINAYSLPPSPRLK